MPRLFDEFGLEIRQIKITDQPYSRKRYVLRQSGDKLISISGQDVRTLCDFL
jgi:hypothetical protein